jgi:LacI family purine nucleotide synthesis repressor
MPNRYERPALLDSPPPAKPLLKDVAALANVSLATASQALRDGPVSTDTRRAVLDAAAKLRYVPQASGRLLRTGRSRSVGLWVLNQADAPELTEDCSFFYAVLRGALEEVESAGFSFRFGVLTGSSEQVGSSLARTAASGTPGGFIVIPQWQSDGRYVEGLAGAGVPYATINDAPAGPSVLVDNDMGIRLAVQHLVDRGHREIGYLAGPRGHLDAERRLAAFYRVAAEHGLRVPASWVQRVAFTVDGGVTGFGRLAERAKGDGEGLPSALLAANDYVAAGSLRSAQQHGLRVPDELSVVGFDDVDVARATFPALTTIRQPLRELGRRAAAVVLALLEGEPAASAELPVELIVRDSVHPR